MNHNKRRNTAFLYEALVRELTKAVVNKDEKRKEQTLKIIKEFFNNKSLLKKDLSLYKEILESRGQTQKNAEKIIYYIKAEKEKLNSQNLFKEQSHLIDRINKTLTPEVFSNFIPNYKAVASIYQMFSDNSGIKTKVLMEGVVLEYMTTKQDNLSEEKRIDNATMKIFSSKFNHEYTNLLDEQKTLLNKYVSSFKDNGLELKIYLNDEIGRIKETIENNKNKFDHDLKNKMQSVYQIIESFKGELINEDMLKKIMKMQSLIREIESND